MSEHRDGFKYCTVAWITDALASAQRGADWALIREHGETTDDGEPVLEVRLQVVDGDAIVRTGDAQFDADGRGYWGASCIGPDDDTDALTAIARDLLSQAQDMADQDPGNEYPGF